jgi:hypothetical protein
MVIMLRMRLIMFPPGTLPNLIAPIFKKNCPATLMRTDINSKLNSGIDTDIILILLITVIDGISSPHKI